MAEPPAGCAIAFWPSTDSALIRHRGEQPESLAVMEATAQVVIDTAKPGKPRRVACIENALPADAEVVRIAQHPRQWDTLLIVLRCEAFTPVEPGGEIPLLPDPVFRDMDAWETLHK